MQHLVCSAAKCGVCRLQQRCFLMPYGSNMEEQDVLRPLFCLQWNEVCLVKPYGWPGAFANTHPNLGWGLSAHSPILRYGQDPNPTAIANCHSILRVLNTRTPILRHIQNPILRHAQSCRYIRTFFMCSLCAFSPSPAVVDQVAKKPCESSW